MSIEIESWMTPADVLALSVFEPLRERAERAVAEGGDVPYWLGYVAGITDAMLALPNAETGEADVPRRLTGEA